MLQRLISALDCPSHDIYVHIDRRVCKLPDLTAKHSHLYMLSNRRKVYWGDVTVVAVELHLLQQAVNSGIYYEYYHIISGTHYPLMSNDELDEYFSSANGKSIIMKLRMLNNETDKRLGRYNFFVPLYSHPNLAIRKVGQLMWRTFLFAQIKLGIKRDTSHFAGKASNWVSLSRKAAKIFLEHKKEILKNFRFTFCSDEFFILSVLEKYGLEYLECPNYLYQQFVLGRTRAFVESDYEELINLGALFGRKFTNESFSLIRKIEENKCIAKFKV